MYILQRYNNYGFRIRVLPRRTEEGGGEGERGREGDAVPGKRKNARGRITDSYSATPCKLSATPWFKRFFYS